MSQARMLKSIDHAIGVSSFLHSDFCIDSGIRVSEFQFASTIPLQSHILLSMGPLDAENLKLTDFMDLQTLQEIQDNFASIANVRATITDADGNVLTQAQPTR